MGSTWYCPLINIITILITTITGPMLSPAWEFWGWDWLFTTCSGPMLFLAWQNDLTFNPILPSSVVHEDYQQSTDCLYEKVNWTLRKWRLLTADNVILQVIGHMKATPVKVQSILTNMHANLKRMINWWEQSGNGDGGMLDAEENLEFGLLDNWTLAALHNRAMFLPGSKRSYLLIF
jgi:hypothetical protein